MQIIQTNTAAMNAFKKCVTYGKCRDYLDRRFGGNKSAISAFDLGWSGDGTLLRGCIREEELREAKLLLDKDGREYEMFSERVMFPIRDADGAVVGFAGRVVDESQPKYLNSHKTEAYNKSEILYGLNIAKEHIARHDMAVVCEGYMDVIAAHTAGIPIAVATCGTSFCDGHALLLMRLCDNVVLCMDSDKAGIAATKQAITSLQKYSFRISVAVLSGSKDPDEEIRKNGGMSFMNTIREAARWYEWWAKNVGVPKFPSVRDYSSLAAYLS